MSTPVASSCFTSLRSPLRAAETSFFPSCANGLPTTPLLAGPRPTSLAPPCGRFLDCLPTLPPRPEPTPAPPESNAAAAPAIFAALALSLSAAAIVADDCCFRRCDSSTPSARYLQNSLCSPPPRLLAPRPAVVRQLASSARLQLGRPVLPACLAESDHKVFRSQRYRLGLLRLLLLFPFFLRRPFFFFCAGSGLPPLSTTTTTATSSH